MAILGTTVPPSVSSIAARGEWTMGKVLDLYFQFAEPGDHYLGQVLVGLDVNSLDFATLPPHFNTDNPMSNDAICEAMNSMFSLVLQKHAGTTSDPLALLLRVLPSVIYHSDWLMDQVRQNPGHPFSAIPLLNNEALMVQLKPLVTTDPIGQIRKATGVPPTIEIAQNSKKVLALCIETLEAVQAMGETVKDAVFQAFEHRVIENGQMTTQPCFYKASRRCKHLCRSKSSHFGMPVLWSLVPMLSMLLMMMTVPFLLMGWMTTKLGKLGAQVVRA
jgi:hypothetical protein